MGRINPLIAIGIPSWGTVSLKWAQQFRGLAGMLGSTMVMFEVIGKPIAEAGNELMANAVAHNCDFLFMLGDDVLPPGDAIVRLWQRMQDNPEIDLITGVYWTKSHPTQPYIWKGLQRGPYLDWKAGEFFPIDQAGCDCLLIRMSDRVRELGPQWFRTDWTWEADQERPDLTLNTEDFYFYTRARAAGIQLWCDTEVQCLHEDRTSRQLFGLRNDMPQAGGEVLSLPEAGTDAAPKVKVADIGAGNDTPYFGAGAVVVRFDGDQGTRPDYRCDLRRLPVPDQSFDVIHSRHVLEHFGRGEVPNVLREWLRILRIGGELRLNVPNALTAMKHVIAMENGEEPYDRYRGWQLYGEQATPYDYHRIGFTPKTLRWLLEDIGGLTDIEVTTEWDENNIVATAKKVSHPDTVALVPLWDEIAAREGKPVEGLAPRPRLPLPPDVLEDIVEVTCSDCGAFLVTYKGFSYCPQCRAATHTMPAARSSGEMGQAEGERAPALAPIQNGNGHGRIFYTTACRSCEGSMEWDGQSDRQCYPCRFSRVAEAAEQLR